jgi:hypothetical protein
LNVKQRKKLAVITNYKMKFCKLALVVVLLSLSTSAIRVVTDAVTDTIVDPV